MPINITDSQYRSFVLGLTGALPLSPNQLWWLGHGSGCYADPWVIEAAVRDTPVRLSFKPGRVGTFLCPPNRFCWGAR